MKTHSELQKEYGISFTWIKTKDALPQNRHFVLISDPDLMVAFRVGRKWYRKGYLTEDTPIPTPKYWFPINA
jgi:hypothetical protein